MKTIFKKMPFLITVILLSFLAVIMRLTAIFTNIEIYTGFYKNPYAFTRISLIIILFLSLFFGIAWFYFSKKHSLIPMNFKFDFGDFLSNKVILGLVTIGFAFNTFYEIFRIGKPITEMTLSKLSTFYSIISALFSALSLAYFIILCFLNNNSKVGKSILTVIPLIWAGIRIIVDFLNSPAILTVSNSLLNIIYLSSLMICLLSYGKIITESNVSAGYKVFTIFAPLTIVLGFTLLIPSAIGFIFGADCVSRSDVFKHIIDFMFSIFFVYFSMNLYNEKIK